MKRIICLCLTICLIALANISPFTFTNESKNVEDSFTWDICSVSDFSSKLEAEDIDVENSEAYDIYMLIETKDVLPNNTFAASNISMDSGNVDDLLKEHRESVKNYFSVYNTNVASVLGLDEYTYYVSYYSPYIEVVFDDLTEYEQCESNIIASVENNIDLLSSVSSYAQVEMIPEATVDDSSYTTYYPIIEAFHDIGVSNSQYTGNGVNVGIIDYNIPHTTANLKPGKYTMLTPPRAGDENHNHGTIITSIIGGTSGIAEDVHFYCLTNSGNMIQDANLLLDYNVNIINVSLGAGTIGRYTKRDACVDYIVSTSGCTFVKSAGNQSFDENNDNIRDEDQKFFYITGPGCSMDAITVGSINYSHNLADSSCWNTLDPFLYKPDVVAPGGWLYGLANFSGTVGGTSCSAPMVTGTIALLMEEFPMLKTNPTLVKSIVHLGAEKLPSQSNYFDQQAGFGLINYQNMRECLINSKYSNFSVLPSFAEGSIVLSYSVTIPAGKQININANLIVYSGQYNETSELLTPSYTDYSIKIYDFASSAYVATSTIDSSVDYLLYANGTTSDKQIRVDIVLESENASGQVEFGSIAYEIVDHIHAYNRYVYLNKLSHRAVCDCGATGTIGVHYTNSGDVDGDGYAPCSACGYLMDLRDDGSEGIMSIPQVSVNGSYILPNGIVVLVDEDVEAYLAGTLQFYHPADLPVTE